VEWRFVVPHSLQSSFLELAHDDLTAGHLSFCRTYDKLRQRCYWPSMSRSVSKYVRSCLACQSRKGPKHNNLRHLKSILPPLSPFETVGIDFLGPFPLSSDGNRYIIVSVDYLTKYSETKAVPTA